MNSQGYLSVGQTTSLKVDKAQPMTSTNMASTGTKPGTLTTTPITINSNGNRYSSGQAGPSTSYAANQSYSSNQGAGQQTNYQPSILATKPASRTAKDFLLNDGLEGRAETQHMRRSQQVVIPNSTGGYSNEFDRQSTKFEPRMTHQEKPGVFQSSYVPRDTMGGRDTFGSGGGINSNMNATNFQYIAELERNSAELRMEYNNLRRTTMQSERQLTQYAKEIEYIQDENTRLRNDLHKSEQLRGQLEEVTLDLDRMKADRDFHNEQHLNLRKELLEIVKQEYELDSLRREKVFIEGELKNYKEKSIIYEKQIDELTILAKRPISKNTADGSDKQEHYYAKKILELETKLKDLKRSNDELKHENVNYKAGIKTNLDESRLNEAGGFRATTPDSLLEQVNLLKKKNDTLKKENDILRRERNTGSDLPKFGGSSSDGNADNRIKELQKQIETLTRKNVKLEQDYMVASGGVEVMELKMKLEEADRQISRLKSQGGHSSGFGADNGLTSSYNDKLQKMVNELLEEKNQLQQEKNELMASMAEGPSDSKVIKLISENSELRAEREKLKQKIQELQRQIEDKDVEIRLLKSSVGGEGQDQAQMHKQLLENNRRLAAELNSLQEKMRVLDSMNMSYTQGGNSMLTPYSQFMAP